MEFRTVFVLWLLVLVPYALGATKRSKRDAMDTANQNMQNVQKWLQEVKSGLSAEQQKRLDDIGSSNPDFFAETLQLMQEHASDTEDEFKQAAKALVDKYLNGGAGPQSDSTPDIPDTTDIPGMPDIPDTTDIPGIPDIPDTTDIPGIPDIPDTTDIPGIPGIPDIPDIPDWVASGFSAEQQQRLMTIASNPNFLREYGEILQKHGGVTDSDEFKQAVKALAERYVNGGTGLVVSLVALVASLVLQRLVMFG